MVTLVLQESLPKFYDPSPETLEVLGGGGWVCSFSGGKDSTALVTFIESLRKRGLLDSKTPRLVLSDTGAEYPFLNDLARRMMDLLTSRGWTCEVVTPRQKDKLYCQIFGRGVTPIYPGVRKMRWCTRATKIDPMERYAKTLGEGVILLSGVRWGSLPAGTGPWPSAGGECGLPAPGSGRYAPIISWKTCQVLDWLAGAVDKSVRESYREFLPLTKELIGIYGVKESRPGLLPGLPPEVTALRYGCVGCPAVTHESVSKNPLRQERVLYLMWERLRNRRNRCRRREGDRVVYGPVKMEVRKAEFVKFLAFMEESKLDLLTKEDESYIKNCWEKKTYPRGWGGEHEW